jgi:CubicO group peptidase (beta-lactamase class C family)
MATTSIAMKAVHEGRLAVEQPVGDILEEWRDAAHAPIQIRHLLDHSSGLPAHVTLWHSVAGRAQYEAAIHALPLEYPAGTRAVYSDVGFITLGFVLERLGRGPLDSQYAELQRRAWGGRATFNPRGDVHLVAPTEIDDTRGVAIQGTVHDENARALGGVAGHAGLFGTVTDVGRFARMVLQSFGDTTPLATPDLMRTFARETGVPGSSRALGWDVMRPTSSSGTRLSPTAIGHTGFTGTSLWIDPGRDLYVAFLTNRIHPTRTNEALIALRPQLHDAIVTSLT